MKDEIIILIRKWFKSKTGIDLIHDPSLISLVNEIEALRIHNVVGQSEQLQGFFEFYKQKFGGGFNTEVLEITLKQYEETL